MAKLNTKGKPKRTATIKQMNHGIFHNLPNEELDLAELVKEPTLKEDIMERFKPSDEIITCGSCHKEIKSAETNSCLKHLTLKQNAADAIRTCQLNRGNAHVTNHGINVKNIAEQARFSED